MPDFGSHTNELLAKGKSNLEQSEDVLRRKLWSQEVATRLVDILSSQLKTLPVALIVNGIALAVTSKEAYIRDGATWSFRLILVWLVVAFAAFLFLSLRLPKILRHVEMARRDAERLRNQAEDMFREYKATLMPQSLEPIYGFILDVKGRVTEFFRNRTWRENQTIPIDIQKDMEFIDGSLVQQMDNLDAATVEFYRAFDSFSEACYPILSKWGASVGDMKTEFINSAIVALYRFYTGDVQNENMTMDAQNQRLIDSDGRSFLEKYFFKGHPNDSSDISHLMVRADLKEKTKDAMKAQGNGRAQYDRVIAQIRYKYTGGR